MLQSAIFADLQVNNFGIPTVRLVPTLPILSWAKVSFSQISLWLRNPRAQQTVDRLNDHLLRDIGIDD